MNREQILEAENIKLKEKLQKAELMLNLCRQSKFEKESIEAQKQSMNQIERFEKFRNVYTAFWRNSPIGQIVFDKNFNIADANIQTLELIGLSLDFAINRDFADFIDYKSSTKFAQYKEKVLSSVESLSIELELIKSDGESRFVLLHSYKYFEPEKGELRINSFLQDISEHKKTKDRLADYESRFDYLNNNMSDLFFVTNEKGDIIHVNQIVLDKLCCKGHEIIGTPLFNWVKTQEDKVKFEQDFYFIRNINEYELKIKDDISLSVKVKISEGVWDSSVVYYIIAQDITPEIDASDKFAKAFHNNAASMAISDFDTGVFLDVNEKFLELTGFSKEEVLGKTAVELQLFPDLASRESMIDEVKANGFVKDLHLEVKNKLGKEIFGLFSADLFVVKGKKHLISVWKDLTEKVKIEKEILTQKNLLDTIINNAPIGIWITNQDGSFKLINKYFAKAIAYNPTNGHSTMTEIERNEFALNDKNALNSSGHIIKIEPVTCSDNYKHYYQTFKTKIVESNGNISGILGLGHDITESNRALEALRQSEENLRKLFELSPFGIVLCEIDGKFIRANNAFLEMTEYRMNELAAFSYWDLSPEKYRQNENAQKVNLEKNGLLGPYEKEIISKNGSCIPVAVNGISIKDKAGNQLLWAIIQNISDRKKSDELLNKRLEFIEFIGRISSEIIKYDSSQIDQGIVSALEFVTNFVNASRGYVFLISDDKSRMFLTHEWCTPNSLSHSGIADTFEMHVFRKINEKYEIGNNIVVHSRELKNSEEEAFILKSFAELNIKSLINVPLMRGDNMIGYVGLDYAAEDIVFTADHINTISLTGKVIVNALERQKTEDKLLWYTQDLELTTLELEDKTKRIEREEKILKATAEVAALLLDTIDYKLASDQIIEILGESTNVHRVLVYEIEPLSGYADLSYEWICDGVDSVRVLPNCNQIDLNFVLPNWAASFNSKQPVFGVLPDCESKEQDFLNLHQAGAFIALPIIVRHEFWGFILFEVLYELRDFQLSEIAALSIAVGAFGSAIERKHSYISLESAKKAAEEANKSKSEFLANMSHEIRTPMNAILGFSEILLNKIENPQHKSYLSTILTSGKTLLTLINDILDLSKIESGKLDIQYESVDISLMLEEIKQMFQPKASEKRITLYTEIEGVLPDNLFIDEVRLRQVLFNLVGNAVKFTDNGFIKLRYESINIYPDTKTIDFKIHVEDSGIGIPAKQLAAIFDSFIQVSGQSNRKYGGTGLGLSISKKLANMMNGDLTVESELNKGSVFTIRLNKVKIAQAATSKTSEYNWFEQDIEFIPANILVVDDVPHNRELLISYLEHTKLTVFEAQDGETAIDLIEKQNFDLIFMDLRMPGMGGVAATDLIKNVLNKKTPIIAFTASIMKEEEILIENLFEGFMRKPINKKDLFKELKKYLGYKVNKPKDVNIAESQDISLSEDMKAALPDLIEALEKIFLPQSRNLAVYMVVDEIEEFLNELDEFNKSFKIEIISKYNNELREFLANFDFSQIENFLKSFSAIIDKLKEIS